MKRRDLLKGGAALGCLSAFPFGAKSWMTTGLGEKAGSSPVPLKPPDDGNIPVAFVLSDGAVMIDFAGPWEVFQDATSGANDMSMKMGMFNLYTVAETTKPIRASGGMKIIPDYSFADAPAPKVIVIPAQSAQGHPSQAMQDWIRKSAKTADVTMSVCTGAFLLANTGLLSGKAATTHHSAYKQMAMDYPDIQLKRGARFVDNGNIATAGGLSSGIDLALHVVERYYGREAAESTAYQMEYQGKGWTDPSSNQIYAAKRVSTAEHPLCAVCDMDVNSKTAPKSVYKGNSYYFCSEDHKEVFDKSPQKYVDAM
ncbi:MAG TPA: DJ-1/PfpI family protein [Terriglobales bacterium]|nr:DJ-1/PfpI family protein [Terriglobales bacterium]